MKKTVVALFALAALTSAAIPAHADNANIQESDQTSIITGDENISTQNQRQNIRDVRINSNDNSGNVQSGRQTSDTYGNRNDTLQDSEQTIREVSVGGRSRR